MSEWIVYIIRTDSGKLYTGITTDLPRRLKEHQTKKGAKFFNTCSPESVVFQEKHPDRSSALKREAQIKRLSRRQKEELLGMPLKTV